ncbi:ABC transporter permease [Carboxylicivirga sp. M1479]|uniref:ABC transporter permease n=1 Tax=Carboxylicivirga sp. M1479 TaxID=2594476 RepID=UPI0011786B5D|nr:ABC transporter permease [Carboxylicivirga sp. M1479]TRX66198.1 FtsX-like permease family protein [Carboxylicivirga sp. M1479]
MKLTLLQENLRIALGSIRTNLLRTILTILIIGIGLTALIGILTAISSIEATISNKFTGMGANSFTIENRGMNVQIGKRKLRNKRYGYISFKEAMEFKDEFDFPAIVTISHTASGSATVKHESEKSNPNVMVIGVDENFMDVEGHVLQSGRNFTQQEIKDNRYVALLGSALAKKVFPNDQNAVGKVIVTGGAKYRVIGVLEEKGAGFGSQSDNIMLLPVTNVRQVFSRANMSYKIVVKAIDSQQVDIAISEATGLFRVIRRLTIHDEDNFNVNKSDNLSRLLIESTGSVTLVASIIGLITLLGAAIGLMNIMLVAVAERTREIGIRKATGASSKAIRNQFLFESIIIGQMGGFVGIVLGVFVGNLMSMVMDSDFIVPWNWVILGVLVCLVVGVLSGLMPAIKASKLDPIESLRYE